MHPGLSLSLICTAVVDDCIFIQTSKWMKEKKKYYSRCHLPFIWRAWTEVRLKLQGCLKIHYYMQYVHRLDIAPTVLSS